MRAVVIRGPGGPEVLEIREVPEPQPGPEDVLVRVRAAALNRADVLQRRGRYPAPPDVPRDIPGLEFAGEIERCGERVRSFQAGDRVMGIVGGGAQAEKLVLHERLCMPIPPALHMEQAAAVPEAFLTAYDALFHGGSLAPGEVVLVQAAASGVGTAVAQLARIAGGRVLGLARSAPKRERLAALGLVEGFDPQREDLADALRAASGGGIDLAVDLVGAPAWPLYAQVLRERGRVVVLGLLGGATVELDLAWLMRTRVRIVGSVLRSRQLEERIGLVQEFTTRILPLLAAGRLAPVTDSTLALDEVATGHARLERNESFGKIVLRVSR